MSRSRRIVASSFDWRAWSAYRRSVSFRFAPETSSIESSRFSSDPNWAISWPAVLSPIPGTPAIWSDVSPFSPMKSGTRSGGMP